MSQVSKQQAINELWRRGNLRWKLHAVQKEMYDLFYGAKPNSVSVWLLARQSGKSFLITVLAAEYALKHKNAIIKVVTDTKLHASTILEPLFRDVFADCPVDLKPDWNSQKFSWTFPNGSQIQLAGSDGKHYERLRGQKSHLILIDEAGFCSDLDDMINSVLIPTTTHTGGKLILATTPPTDPNHPFLDFMEKAKHNNQFVMKTLDDNPLLTDEIKRNIEEQMGGRGSERFRREYLCEIFRDNTTTVIPEFTKELQSEIVREWPKPPFLDSYVSMDLGFKDLTVVLFGYYDYRNAKVIIEDEIVVDFQKSGMNLEQLTQLVLKKEEELYTNIYTNEIVRPILRVSDINYIVTNEMLKYSNQQLIFQPAKKDDNEAAINNLKVMISGRKIIINPKCKTLIQHLENAKWKPNSQKTLFARSPDNGHYDALDALKYMVRHIRYEQNPYPAYYDVNRKNIHVANPELYNNKYNQDAVQVYKQIFNPLIRKRR